MRFGWIALAVGLGASTAFAAPVRGRVVDARGKPVEGATAACDTQTVTTAADGKYALDCAEGSTVLVAAVGYALGLGSTGGEDVVLDREEKIEIHGEAPIAAAGAARLDRSEMERIPGTGNDVMRTLQAMPGVVSYPLPIGANGVVIRGSSPYDSKVLVDDFEVPMLYHDIGFRSIVPVESIDSLEYLPGGFDVGYGRAASGVVSLTTRAGGEERGEQAELGGSDAGVQAHGTMGGATYMLALRRSMIDLILPALLPGDLDLSLTTVPRYYDEQLRVDYKLSHAWKLKVSSLGSDDAMELFASKDKNPDKRFLQRTRFVRLTAAAGYHDGPWTANLALSGIAQQFLFERGVDQHLDDRAPGVTARAEVLRSAKAAAGLKEVLWRAGGELVVTEHQIDVAMPRQSAEGTPEAADDPMDTSQTFAGGVETVDFATWSSIGANLDERIRATTGVRIDAFTRVHDTAVQPRGELQIKLAPKVLARLSAGLYTRPPEHQLEILAPGLVAERAKQLAAGVQWEPADGVRVQPTLYYTDRSRLVVTQMDGSLANTGRGTTYGAELLATVRRGPWFAWLTYSYSHSVRQDAPGAATRLFDYDQPHSLSAAGSFQWRGYTFGARFRLFSGLPSTPVENAVFDSDANKYDPLYGDINSVRAPIHHQLDLRIDRVSHWGGVKITRFLDVQNVYMNDSVVGYFYGFDYTQRAAFRSLPILPTAGLRGEF